MVANVTKTIHTFLPGAKLRQRYGAEVIYELSPKQVPKFGELFKRLEDVNHDLGIESFGMDLPGLEDVFIK